MGVENVVTSGCESGASTTSKPLVVGVPSETYPAERRVALIPASLAALKKAKLEVVVQAGAGAAAGFLDADYIAAGAELVPHRHEVLARADIVLQVRAAGANAATANADIDTLRPGQVLIGMCDPLGTPQAIADLASTGASVFALELIPRITRAQTMDVLSSQATIAGYRAVLLGAIELPKLFPQLMTAAGTLRAARILVVGAGVAGLQAIATAKRLGGIVLAYDVRPACREQIESLGGKFVELPVEITDAEDQGGYAKTLGEDFYRRQRELLGDVVAQSDVVITTAAIPGKPAPLLVTRAAVERMAPGSVIVDLATERGGNCELSQADQRVVHRGVTIWGPTNLPAEAPNHASQMFSNNLTKFLLNMVQDGQTVLHWNDEIVRESLVAHGGQVVQPRLRELLNLPPFTDSHIEASQNSKDS